MMRPGMTKPVPVGGKGMAPSPGTPGGPPITTMPINPAPMPTGPIGGGGSTVVSQTQVPGGGVRQGSIGVMPAGQTAVQVGGSQQPGMSAQVMPRAFRKGGMVSKGKHVSVSPKGAGKAGGKTKPCKIC